MCHEKKAAHVNGHMGVGEKGAIYFICGLRDLGLYSNEKHS